MLNMHKKRKTNTRLKNVVVSSEEEGDSGRLEQCHKRRIDHVGPSTMMVATPASPSTSSPSIAYVSSLITLHDSSPFFAPLFIPLSFFALH